MPARRLASSFAQAWSKKLACRFQAGSWARPASVESAETGSPARKLAVSLIGATTLGTFGATPRTGVGAGGAIGGAGVLATVGLTGIARRISCALVPRPRTRKRASVSLTIVFREDFAMHFLRQNLKRHFRGRIITRCNPRGAGAET